MSGFDIDPVGGSPWGDEGSTTPAADPAFSSETQDKAASPPTSPQAAPAQSTASGRSTMGRSSRQPRRAVGHVARFEAVDHDPLAGGLDVESPLTTPATEHPPEPPRKEPAPRSPTAVSARIAAGPSSVQRARLGDLMGDLNISDDEDEGPRKPRLPPPVQPAGPLPQRSNPPSVPVEEAAKVTFEISVGDPHKVGDLTSAHIVYSVRTKTTSKAYKVPEFQVTRRYSDFLWLYNALHTNNPGIIVPPPPEKQAVGRFDNSFVETRRAALEKMLNRIAAHPTLQQDADLKIFLESETFNADIKHKEKGPLEATGSSKGMFSGLGFGGTLAPKFIETDEWFHDRKLHLETLESSLKSLLKSLDIVLKQRRDLADAALDFSTSLHSLSQIELSKALSSPLSALSDLQLRIKDVHDRQAHQDILTIGITIDEYIRIIASAKKAFDSRAKAFVSWHQTDSELNRKKSSFEKLQRQGKSQQDRINMAAAEVAEAERRMHSARLLFEDVGRLLRSELERFDKEKVEDFKSGVETFLESSVEAQKELIEIWETFLMQLDLEEEDERRALAAQAQQQQLQQQQEQTVPTSPEPQSQQEPGQEVDVHG